MPNLTQDTGHMTFFFFFVFFLSISVRFGIGATICTHQEIQCLPMRGFYLLKITFYRVNFTS